MWLHVLYGFTALKKTFETDRLKSYERACYGPFLLPLSMWSMFQILKSFLGRSLTVFRNWECSCAVGVFQHDLLLQYFVLSIQMIFRELECPKFKWLTKYFMTSFSVCQEVKITNPKWKYCASSKLGENLELCS